MTNALPVPSPRRRTARMIKSGVILLPTLFGVLLAALVWEVLVLGIRILDVFATWWKEK